MAAYYAAMNPKEQTADEHALAANDIHVITDQLNEAIKRCAESGLRVEINCTSVIDVKGGATYYPVLSARVLSELR